jgi:hypothetical protein
MLEVWHGHLISAWHDRRSDHFALHLSMAGRVPGAEASRARWARRARLLPLARLWDALPATITVPIRRLRRVLASAVRHDLVAA